MPRSIFSLSLRCGDQGLEVRTFPSQGPLGSYLRNDAPPPISLIIATASSLGRGGPPVGFSAFFGKGVTQQTFLGRSFGRGVRVLAHCLGGVGGVRLKKLRAAP